MSRNTNSMLFYLALILLQCLWGTAAFSQAPTQSSAMVFDQAREQIWVVNPDNHSVSRISTANGAQQLVSTHSIGLKPQSIALAPNGNVWVPCRDDDTIHVLSPSGQAVSQSPIRLPYGSRPTALAISPNGQDVYVSFEGQGRMARFQSDRVVPYSAAQHLLPEQNGVNFEFYDWFGSAETFPITNASQIQAGLFRRRFIGMWDGNLNEDLRLQFQSETPDFRPWQLSGVNDTFAFVMRSQLNVATAGNYRFLITIGADDGVELLVNENTALNFTAIEATTQEITVPLNAGRNRLVLKYFDRLGTQNLRVQYQGPGMSSAIDIPATALYPDQDTRKLGSIAINTDGTVYVAQTMSDDHRAVIHRYRNAQWLTPLSIIYDEITPPDGDGGPGVINYLTGLSIAPNGQELWYSGKKDNHLFGVFRNGSALNFENTIRAMVGVFNLQTGQEPLDQFGRSRRIDIDNQGFPSFLRVDQERVFIVSHINNEVLVYSHTGLLVDNVRTGLAPTALLTTNDHRVAVKNLNERNVTFYNGRDLILENRRVLSNAANFMGAVVTVPPQEERLSPQELLGRQHFTSARNIAAVEHGVNPSNMSADSYISCAVCHLDGGHDGRTLDFTDRGEGLRNTTSLRGRAGMGHGNVHWSANFNEIQDFENDISGPFGGTGFTDGAHPPLFSSGNTPAPNNAGRSEALDAIAAYVSSLGDEDLPRSPYRQADGGLTAEAQLGSQVFLQMNCQSCHAGSNFTDSTVGLNPTLHNIGTIKSGENGGSGQRLNTTLPGIDTPTLKGVWATAPYLHDGSASTLSAVFEQHDASLPEGDAHNLSRLSSNQRSQLFAYVLSLDGSSEQPNRETVDAPRNLRITGIQ